MGGAARLRRHPPSVALQSVCPSGVFEKWGEKNSGEKNGVRKRLGSLTLMTTTSAWEIALLISAFRSIHPVPTEAGRVSLILFGSHRSGFWDRFFFGRALCHSAGTETIQNTFLVRPSPPRAHAHHSRRHFGSSLCST